MSKKDSVFNCVVCKKNYWKIGSHSKCYKKFCWICNIEFETPELQQEHSEKFHIERYCIECKECNNNLFVHIKNHH